MAKLARRRPASLRKIAGVGVKYAAAIEAWQTQAQFSHEVAYVGPMIQEDAAAILELGRRIKALDAEIAELAESSAMARRLISIPGFGPTCAAELAGEIGAIERFASEAALALYLGMAPLDNASGKFRGAKPPRHVNRRARAAMMTAVDRHRKGVPQSQRYYETKRAMGKTHNQAIRALGRNLCRVIFKMITTDRPYRIKP